MNALKTMFICVFIFWVHAGFGLFYGICPTGLEKHEEKTCYICIKTKNPLNMLVKYAMKNV